MLLELLFLDLKNNAVLEFLFKEDISLWEDLEAKVRSEDSPKAERV